MAQKQPSNFPKPVTGVTSPYPTCFYFNSNRFKHLAYRSHRDDRPPIGVEHCLESGFRIFFLKDKYEGGEHDGAHPQQEEEEAELLVVGLHRVAEGLESRGVSGQLEDPDDPQCLHNPSHLQKPEVLGCSTNISLAIG